MSRLRTAENVVEIVRDNVVARVPVTDGRKPPLHESRQGVCRARNGQSAGKEYARGDVTTNTVEGYFSIFKRGMRGMYQHCAEKHLHRYLAEFDFRYNYRASLGYNDTERTIAAVRGGEGKRLTYHQPH